MRESFVFYDSYYEAISEFDETIQVHLFKAICEYALYEKVPELSGIEKALFTLIKPTIDANEKRYNNGKKGGRPKKNNGYENKKPTVLNSETNGYENEKPNVNVNDNVNVTVNANVNSNANENKLPDKSDRETVYSGKKKKSFDKKQAENDFEECWKIYPKKQGKAKALKAYLKFAEKDPDLKEKVISGINSYNKEIQRTRKEYKFIKNGDTYFCNECWYDEYSEIQQTVIETTSGNGEWDSIFEEL